jgi:hypothetical protein
MPEERRNPAVGNSSIDKGRHGRDDKGVHQCARPETEDIHQGEGRTGMALLGVIRPYLQTSTLITKFVYTLNYQQKRSDNDDSIYSWQTQSRIARRF